MVQREHWYVRTKCKFLFPAAVDIASRTEAALAKADSGPEAMIARSPVAARDGPPDTGASTKVRPLLRASSCAWITLVSDCPTVDDMMIVAFSGRANGCQSPFEHSLRVR